MIACEEEITKYAPVAAEEDEEEDDRQTEVPDDDMLKRCEGSDSVFSLFLFSHLLCSFQAYLEIKQK